MLPKMRNIMILLICVLPFNTQKLFALSDEIVSVVGERPITKSIVESVMRVFGLQDFDQSLDFVINSYIILNYISSQSIQIQDREVEEIISKMGKISDITRELENLGMSYDEYKDFIKARKFADQIFIELVGGAFITDQEMKKFYDQNEEEIRRAFERRFVYYQELTTDSLKPKIDDMKEIGWVRRGELKKDFDQAIFSLPNTGFTQSVSTDIGGVIFFISKISHSDFSELKDSLDFREFYVKTKYKEVFELWLEGQKKKQKIRRKIY